MGASQRRKGAAGENELVGYLRAHGFEAKKISAMYKEGADVEAFNGRLVEIKRRAKPPSAVIEKWLSDVNLVAYRADRGDWRVVMPLSELLDLLEEADNGELWE